MKKAKAKWHPKGRGWTTRANMTVPMVLLAVSCFGERSLGAVTSYSTGVFDEVDWTTDVLASSTGTSVASTELASGNPGAYRRVSLTVAPFQSVLNSQLWEVATFTPATEGAINSVSLSYDIVRVFTSTLGALQVTKGVSVRQDGVVHTYFAGVTANGLPAWEAVSIPDLVPLFPGVNWVDGNAITFGFHDNVGTSNVGFTIDGGYDNFAVSIDHDVIPEPSAGLLAALGCFGIAVRRRRRITG